MNLCPLLENNRDSVKRKYACARSAGTRGITYKVNIFMMLGTFNFITIPGNCTYVHKILFLERNKQF